MVLFAESEGFEPPVPCGTMVFKTIAIDHSANSPAQKYYFLAVSEVQNACMRLFILANLFYSLVDRNSHKASVKYKNSESEEKITSVSVMKLTRIE